MRMLSAVLQVMVLLLMSPVAVLAQFAQPGPSVSIPRLINISGVFQPADGQPPGAVEAVTLSIYAEAEGGTPLWQETQRVALETTGRYTLLLGAAHAEGIPPAVFASGEAQWLGLLFARGGEVEGPRVRLTSVPYALRASDAETLGGRPASAYVLGPTAGQSEGRATSAASDGEPSGPTAQAVLPGTTNFLSKYVNSSDVGNSAVYETAGKVGLGTTTPLDSFHVRFNNTGGTATGLAVQNLGNTAASYSGMLFYDQFGALAQFQGFNNVTHEYRINNVATNASINFMTGSTSRFRIAPNGSIGIGTTSPSTNLDVSNELSTTTKADITASSYTNTSPFGSLFVGRKARGTAAAPTAAQAHDQLSFFGGRGYGTTGFGQNSGMNVRAAETFTASAQGTYLQFMTTPMGTLTPVPHMRLDPSGRLGLGVFSPSAVVEVVRENATSDIRATSYGSLESGFFTRVARGTALAPTAVEAGDSLGFFAGTGYATTGFGEFGAGMVPVAAENWTDAAQGAALAFLTTPLGSTDADAASMVILPSGNVGIGTFNAIPTITDKLQVFGDIRVGTSGANGCIKNFAGTGVIGTCVSDRRYKRDITPFRPVLNQITALQPVHYFWRADDFPQQHFGDSRAYGLIAQDVEAVLPELVVTGDGGFKAVDYSKLPLLTIQAVKELKVENDALKQRVAENDALKERVEELERLVTEMLATAAHR